MGALSVGVDVVDVREVEDSLSRFGDRYLRRVYAASEIDYALSSPSETARRLAARFAVKEATIKALGASESGIDPRAIHVARGADGRCDVVLHDAARAAAERAGVTSLAVSLTHQGHTAMAVVVAERGRRRGTSRLRKKRRA